MTNLSKITNFYPSSFNEDQSKKEFTSPVAQLQSYLAVDMQQLDREIEDNLVSPISLISQITRYLIHAGGKRIRPLLTMAFSELFGVKDTKVIKLAAAVEFIHTATLLHDDVVDDSHLRRGKITARDLWGNQASVLVGDFLFSKSFHLMVQTKNPAILNILALASVEIAQGEVLQLANSHDLALAQETALEIMRAKTAELFAASCQSGAMVANQSDQIVESSRLYGLYLGMIFQIVDDILDYKGDPNQAGKNVGTDFKEGKVTLPIVFAYNRCDDREKEFFRRVLIDKEQLNDDFDLCVQLIDKYDGFIQARHLADDYARKAHSQLANMPDNQIKACLHDIVDYCLDRNT